MARNPITSEARARYAQATIAPWEWVWVLASCAALSVAAIVWSWQHEALLNYGDAVAHLHIARRVFDSHQPRFSQLGSVWLPLPHILLLPFVQVYAWWANGLAGVFPSALAYVAACAGMYRLARIWMGPVPAGIGLAWFALNPNLLYLQTTAMTEPLFVCEMIWLVVGLVEWRSHLDGDPKLSSRRVWFIALLLVCAVYTRYDGWAMTLVAWSIMGVTLARRRLLRLPAFWLASGVVVAAPLAWFVYNSAVFGDWLYFLRGPYSAKAIEMRTQIPGYPPHPGWHNPWVALLFYMKAAVMDAAAMGWGRALLLVSALGAGFAWIHPRYHGLGWALLLALPIPFYAYSVAYGSVPIFLPVWWPFSWYNVRYGMELLPGFALCLGFAAQFVTSSILTREQSPNWLRITRSALFALVVWNGVQMLREQPIAYVEGVKNIEAHRGYEQEIPAVLRWLLARRPGATILMNTSIDPQIVALTGIPLRQTINESDLGVYRDALEAPGAHAEVVLAYDGDEIANAVKAHPEGLTEYRRFSARFQPSITLYVTGTLDAWKRTVDPSGVVASLKENQ
jgi:hypothetical protein